VSAGEASADSPEAETARYFSRQIISEIAWRRSPKEKGEVMAEAAPAMGRGKGRRDEETRTENF
jgi:hypothetical protein